MANIRFLPFAHTALKNLFSKPVTTDIRLSLPSIRSGCAVIFRLRLRTASAAVCAPVLPSGCHPDEPHRRDLDDSSL